MSQARSLLPISRSQSAPPGGGFHSDAPCAVLAPAHASPFRRVATVAAKSTFPCRSRRSDRRLQLVPVIALAISDRLPKVWPFQAKPSSRIMTRSSRPFHSRTSSAPAFSATPCQSLWGALVEGDAGASSLSERGHGGRPLPPSGRLPRDRRYRQDHLRFGRRTPQRRCVRGSRRIPVCAAR